MSEQNLFELIETCNKEGVTEALSKDAQLNDVNENGFSPFLLALEKETSKKYILSFIDK